jgi:hypothetical protein
MRVRGHALTMGRSGKFSAAYKPRCKCGWVGDGGNQSGAKAQYRSHLANAASAKATGAAA